MSYVWQLIACIMLWTWGRCVTGLMSCAMFVQFQTDFIIFVWNSIQRSQRNFLDEFSFSFKISWCRDVVMSWCHNAAISWCSDVITPWCHDVVMPWCRDVIVLWCHNAVMSWCRDVIIPLNMMDSIKSNDIEVCNNHSSRNCWQLISLSIFQTIDPLKILPPVRTDNVTALNIFPGATGVSTLTLKLVEEGGMISLIGHEFLSLTIPSELKYPENICHPAPHSAPNPKPHPKPHSKPHPKPRPAPYRRRSHIIKFPRRRFPG